MVVSWAYNSFRRSFEGWSGCSRLVMVVPVMPLMPPMSTLLKTFPLIDQLSAVRVCLAFSLNLYLSRLTYFWLKWLVYYKVKKIFHLLFHTLVPSVRRMLFLVALIPS
jgi:hypothetical protein